MLEGSMRTKNQISPTHKFLSGIILASLFTGNFGFSIPASVKASRLPITSNVGDLPAHSNDSVSLPDSQPSAITPLPTLSSPPASPDNYDILHNGSPSTAWTMFAAVGVNPVFGNFGWQ